LKRLAVLCLGLLFCSTHESRAQDYAAWAYDDLSNGYYYASSVYSDNPIVWGTNALYTGVSTWG
jgi:hypothetical protein